MFLLAVALLATAGPTATPPPAAEPARQARSTVRIVRPASLRVGASATLEGVPLRDTKIVEDGRLVPARLAEFE